MQTTKVSIGQGYNQIQFTIEHAHNASKSRIKRTLLYQFIDWYDVTRQCSSKAFKGNVPFEVKFEGSVTFDSCKLLTYNQNQLKLVNSPKGRAKFLGNVDRLLSLALRQGQGELQKEHVEKALLEGANVTFSEN